jgi:hypothetical protein
MDTFIALAEPTVGGLVDMHFHNMSLSSDADIPRPEKYKDMPEKMSFTGKVTRCEPPQTQFEAEYEQRLGLG